MTRILFVDDDEFVLMGLRRLLICAQEDWEVEFANHGPAALKLCAERPFDVVVSDMRMPEMDGSELLTEVSRRYPETIRIILSGQSDREAVFRAVGPAHQYLSKPCTLDKLQPAITRACALRDRLRNPRGLQRAVTGISTLPSLPGLTLEVIELLQNPDAVVEEIGLLIATDAAMSAKVLQLANSSLFGSPRSISNVPQAVSFLGIDLLKPLVLSLGVFSRLEADHVNGISLPNLMSHGAATGMLARNIALRESNDMRVADQSMIAGMLKDVGATILAQHFPTELNEAFLLCNGGNGMSLAAAQTHVLGVNHGETGAYLLGLWGLPYPIVEAVAFHQCPNESVVSDFSPLVAVHAASSSECTRSVNSSGFDVVLDRDFITRVRLSDRIEQWEAVAHSLIGSGGLSCLSEF